MGYKWKVGVSRSFRKWSDNALSYLFPEVLFVSAIECYKSQEWVGKGYFKRVVSVQKRVKKVCSPKGGFCKNYQGQWIRD